MWSVRWRGEECVIEGQLRQFGKTKFGIPRQAGDPIRLWMLEFCDQKLISVDSVSFLTRPVSHHNPTASILGLKGNRSNDQRGSGLDGSWNTLVWRKPAPYDVPCSRLWPPNHDDSDASGNRSDLALVVGAGPANFSSARMTLGLTGPSSASYCGIVRLQSSLRARWIA